MPYVPSISSVAASGCPWLLNRSLEPKLLIDHSCTNGMACKRSNNLDMDSNPGVEYEQIQEHDQFPMGF